MLFNSPFERIFQSPSTTPEPPPAPESPDEPYESTIDKLINYVMRTPYNTNPAVLLQLIKDLNKEEVLAMRGITDVNDHSGEISIGEKQ